MQRDCIPSTWTLLRPPIRTRAALALVMKLSSSMDASEELMDSLTYDSTLCMGIIDSIYYRVVDKSDSSMSKILSSCGSKLTKFTDIS